MGRIAGYQLGAVQGRKGLVATYHAEEESTGRIVCLRVLDGEGVSAVERERFLNEACVTAQLEHPGVVPVYAVGSDELGRAYYATKLVRGISLRMVLGLMDEGVEATVRKYPLGVLLTMFRKVCDVVAYAHSRGVVHRNLKPENVTLGDFGEVFVMNWGAAMLLDVQAGGGGGGGDADEVVGTPEYMSPEQARGQNDAVNERSDVYALGAILYRILTLRAPVQRGPVLEVLGRVERGELLPIEAPAVAGGRLTHLPGGQIPSSLVAVVSKAMALDPVRRYRGALKLRREVERYQNGFLTGAEKGGPWKRAALFLWRTRVAGLAAVLVVLVGGGFAAQMIAGGLRAERAVARLAGLAPSIRDLAASTARMGRMEEAIKHLEVSASLDPNEVETQMRRAWVDVGSGRMGAAVRQMRTVLKQNPGHVMAAKALPVLEKLARRPTPQQWLQEERSALFELLRLQGFSGEMRALAQDLNLDVDEKMELVDFCLKDALGLQGAQVVKAPEDPQQVVVQIARGSGKFDAEALRGLPIDQLEISGTGVSDLGPLRGMRLRRLKMTGTAVSDLSPLKGMPLEVLWMSGAPVSSLEPLRGMPLVSLDASGCRVLDFSPLKGLPLRELAAGRNPGELNLLWLKDAPLVFLGAEGLGLTYVSELQGKPLRMLVLWDNEVLDLSPLENAKIEYLTLGRVDAVSGIDRILKSMPNLKRVRIQTSQRTTLSQKSELPEAIRDLAAHPAFREWGFRRPLESLFENAALLQAWEVERNLVPPIRAGGGVR